MGFILEREDFDAFLTGATLYGTGGGGEAEWGRVIMDNDYDKGRRYEFVAPEDVPDDAFVCSGGIMGSVKSLEDLSYTGIVEEWESDFPLVNAIRTMEEFKGRKVDYLIPFEIGGLNSPVIFSAAARLGIPCIDGDAVGRSAPETHMTSFIGNGVDLYPMPVVDRYGNATIVIHSDSPTYADELGRVIVVKGGGMGANAHYPMTGAQLKEACVPHILSKGLEIGKMLLAAGGDGPKAISDFMRAEQGLELFKGSISSIEGVDKGGFYLTDVEIEGLEAYRGQTAKLVIKNESMALWIDGKIRVMFPDYIFMMDSKTGLGLPSIELFQGTELTLVGAPCAPPVRRALKSPAARLSMGPARYGYGELEYIPFDQLNP